MSKVVYDFAVGDGRGDASIVPLILRVSAFAFFAGIRIRPALMTVGEGTGLRAD